MTGEHDGIYRYVSLYLLPEYYAQGWEIVYVEYGYSAMMKAPI